jgi:hypothetical protein
MCARTFGQNRTDAQPGRTLTFNLSNKELAATLYLATIRSWSGAGSHDKRVEQQRMHTMTPHVQPNFGRTARV